MTAARMIRLCNESTDWHIRWLDVLAQPTVSVALQPDSRTIAQCDMGHLRLTVWAYQGQDGQWYAPIEPITQGDRGLSEFGMA